MEVRKLKLSQITENKDNPRLIKSDKLDKLVKSILLFPEMLEVRPIVVDETYTVIGGNMRLKALNIIKELGKEGIIKRLKGYAKFNELIEGEQSTLINNWSSWNGDVSVLDASELTEEQCREFIIKDNLSFGDYDFDKLSSIFTKEELNDWGLNIDYNIEVDDKIEVNEEDISFESEFNAIQEGKLPIVPKFTEKHECFVITVDNKIDEAFIRDKFGLDENYVSESGDGKIRKTNVISVDKIRDLL